MIDNLVASLLVTQDCKDILKTVVLGQDLSYERSFTLIYFVSDLALKKTKHLEVTEYS